MDLVVNNLFNWWAWKSDEEGGYPNQKVAFDPLTRIIYVNKGVTELSVKSDIYSAWKEWLKESPAAVIPAGQPIAISAIGGDQITDTQELGTTFFLENGWRLQPAPSKEAYTLTVNGNIYTREPGENPFLFAEGVSTSLVRSNIVDVITVAAASVAITEQDIAAIADSVWDEPLSGHTATGTTGKKLGKIATKVQDIALR
jgi:hypothetical protein